MNRALLTIKHAINNHKNEDTVYLEARALAEALGDAVASEFCLTPVSLAEEQKKFRDACAVKVKTLKEDRATLLEQIELGIGGFTRDHVNEVEHEVEAAATGRSVSLPLYPVAVGRLRDAVSAALATPSKPVESKLKKGTEDA